MEVVAKMYLVIGDGSTCNYFANFLYFFLAVLAFFHMMAARLCYKLPLDKMLRSCLTESWLSEVFKCLQLSCNCTIVFKNYPL